MCKQSAGPRPTINFNLPLSFQLDVCHLNVRLNTAQGGRVRAQCVCVRCAVCVEGGMPLNAPCVPVRGLRTLSAAAWLRPRVAAVCSFDAWEAAPHPPSWMVCREAGRGPAGQWGCTPLSALLPTKHQHARSLRAPTCGPRLEQRLRQGTSHPVGPGCRSWCHPGCRPVFGGEGGGGGLVWRVGRGSLASPRPLMAVQRRRSIPAQPRWACIIDLGD